MKVCFITANYPPEAWGGTERVVAALARHLRELGVTVSAISGSDQPLDAEKVTHERHDGVDVARIRKRSDEHDRHGFVRPRLVALVREQLQRWQPDIVHVHSFASLGLGIAAECDALGIPMVVTFHDLWVTCARYFRLPSGGVTCPTGTDRTPCVTCVNAGLQTDADFVANALAERDASIARELGFAALCTAPSATAARAVRDAVQWNPPPAGEIEVLPHGLLESVDAALRAPAPIHGERLRIGTFGGLVREKGVAELLAACRDLACELHLAGPYHEPQFAAELRESAKRHGVALFEHGRFTPADPHPARRLHLAVFPSKCQETYGLVVDEALAYGVPAVVSDCGAFAERVDTPGVVVTPIDQLADALRELVASPPRLVELRNAIPSSLPTIGDSARRHLELYRRLR